MRRTVLLVLFAASCASEDPLGAEGSSTGTAGDSDTAASADTGNGEESSGESGEPSPPATGPELYASLCSGCHGLQGEGTELGYELRHPDRELSTYVIRNGREGLEFENASMANYAEGVISDEQLEQLYDWLDSFDQPVGGAALYADYCASCHGVDPVAGGVIDKDIADKDFNDMSEKVREGVGKVSDPRNDYMSSFSETQLSDADLQAIVDWM